jgi:hypothetical protein
MSTTAITRPVQSYTNESKVRFIAFFVLVLTALYWLTASFWICVLLVADFALRSFDLGRFSPLGLLSDTIIRTFRLPLKPVFLPPKRFAARIGLGFSVAILATHIAGWNTMILSGVLALFAFLESFLGFCAGCYVYSFVQRFRH